MIILDNGTTLWSAIPRLPRFAIFCTVIALSACSESGPAADQVTETEQTYTPAPRYDQRDGDLFMYIAKLSEEAVARGDPNPIATFRYLGQGGGEHRLEMVGDNGSRLAVVECTNPCRVAKQTDMFGAMTRIAVNRGTIFEAAFQDAFNGLLTVSDTPALPTTIPETAQAAPAIRSNDMTPTPDWRGERGTCRLLVRGSTYISGECWIRLEDDGSFQVMSLDERHFAQLLRSGSEASGFWNETPDSSHAHSSLGPMERSGACWTNSSAEICAWAGR